MTKVGFDLQPQGVIVEPASANVGHAVLECAWPTMVRRKFIGDASQKVVRLADIYRIPAGRADLFSENVKTANGIEYGADVIQIERVKRSAFPAPIHDDLVGVDPKA